MNFADGIGRFACRLSGSVLRPIHEDGGQATAFVERAEPLHSVDLPEGFAFRRRWMQPADD